MANALGPYYTVIRYHSLLAPHTMTLPLKGWNTSGDVDAWDGSVISAVTMITALLTLMLPFFDGGNHFDGATIFKQLLPSDDPAPVQDMNFTGLTGTDTGGTWAGAVELIITARTNLFGIARLTMLDAISDDDFNPILVPTTRIANLVNEWTADTNGWAGRDNGQPTTFLKETKNLNQRLRKEYRYD
jgi:hypothetical protein